MSFSLSFLTPIGISFFTFLSFTPVSTFAQNSPPSFNSKNCISQLVKEGLKQSQASVWCNYQQECLVRSQKEGLPPDSAKIVCDCTIKQFRKQYSAEKFKELTSKANSDKKVASQLRQVGEKCFEDILFE